MKTNSFGSALIFSALGIIMTLFSCSKNDFSSEQEKQKDVSSLLISIAGIQNSENSTSGGTKASLKSPTLSPPVVSTKKTAIEGSDRFDVFVNHSTRDLAAEQSDLYEQKRINIRHSQGASSNATKAGTELTSTQANVINMNYGVKYRFLLYEVDGGVKTLYKLIDLASGTTDTTTVRRDKQYEWVAYSYNTTDAIPALTNTESPTITTPVDRELLFAKGSFVPQEKGNHNLPIIFKHQLAKFGLAIDVRGIFARFKTFKAKLLQDVKIYQSDFDLLTGTLNNTREFINLNNLDNLPVRIINNTGEGRMELAYFSTKPEILPTNITFQVDYLEIMYLGEDVWKIPDMTTFWSQSFNFTGFNPAIGKSSMAVVNLIANGFHDGQIIWSRGNLSNGVSYVAEDNTQYNTYYFRKPLFDYFMGAPEVNNSVKGSVIAGGYSPWFISFSDTFPWGYMDAQPANGVTPEYPGDPCSELLHPKGLWRVPSKEDFERLIENPSQVYYTVQGDESTRYVRYTNNAYDELNLRFDGYINGMSPNHKLVSPTEAFYWAWPSNGFITDATVFSSLDPNQAYYYHNSGNKGELITSSEPLNQRRYFVRCVRNNI